MIKITIETDNQKMVIETDSQTICFEQADKQTKSKCPVCDNSLRAGDQWVCHRCRTIN